MKFPSIILVLTIAYTSINGQSPNFTPNNNPGQAVDTTQKNNTGCNCLPESLCNNPMLEIHISPPCTENCDVLMRSGNEICPRHLVQCCPKSPPIFKHSTFNEMSNCPCVPYYQCENNTPCTDGCGGIDMRINDASCSGQNVRCCGGNNTMATVPPIMDNRGNVPNVSPTTTITMSDCPCVDYYLCNNGTTINTDGSDLINERIKDDPTCGGQKVRCCETKNNTTVHAVSSVVTGTPPPNFNQIVPLNKPRCACVHSYICMNGIISTDGAGIINDRFGGENCVIPKVRCCTEVNNVTSPEIPSKANEVMITFDKSATMLCPCVYHYQCVNGTPCTDGCNVIDARYNQDPCPDQMVRCCQVVNTTTATDVPTIPSNRNNDYNGCGKRNPNGVDFRTVPSRSKSAQFGEFPWMVAILWEEDIDSDSGNPGDKNLVYQCGGSLIHPNVVLTATHCVVSGENVLHIRAGEWDFKSDQELSPHQDVKVVTIITHPKYYSGGAYNDIALLILEKPVKIASNVNIVCLPPANKILENINNCYVSGWGKDAISKNSQSILKKVKLPIVQRDVCQEQLKIARSRDDFKLHESFVCAGGIEGNDACFGDGGGPLVCPFSGHYYYQAGIVSWGVGCGMKDVPGLYTNVALLRNWVDNEMINLGYGTSSYTYTN